MDVTPKTTLRSLKVPLPQSAAMERPPEEISQNLGDRRGEEKPEVEIFLLTLTANLEEEKPPPSPRLPMHAESSEMAESPDEDRREIEEDLESSEEGLSAHRQSGLPIKTQKLRQQKPLQKALSGAYALSATSHVPRKKGVSTPTVGEMLEKVRSAAQGKIRTHLESSQPKGSQLHTPAKAERAFQEKEATHSYSAGYGKMGRKGLAQALAAQNDATEQAQKSVSERGSDLAKDLQSLLDKVHQQPEKQDSPQANAAIRVSSENTHALKSEVSQTIVKDILPGAAVVSSRSAQPGRSAAGESFVVLEHPSLGQVRLSFRFEQNTLEVHALTHHLHAAVALREGEAQLGQQVAKHGIRLGRLRVAITPNESKQKEERLFEEGNED